MNNTTKVVCTKCGMVRPEHHPSCTTRRAKAKKLFSQYSSDIDRNMIEEAPAKVDIHGRGKAVVVQ